MNEFDIEKLNQITDKALKHKRISNPKSKKKGCDKQKVLKKIKLVSLEL